MLEPVASEKLFYTPLLRFRLPDHEALDHALLAEGERLRGDSPGVHKSNRGGWHSEGNLFDQPAEPIQTLRRAAILSVMEATRSVSSKVDPDSLDMKLFAWMNMNPTGGFNAPHTHPGAHWSGVYYVRQPKVDSGNSGMIEFLDPRSDLPAWRILQSRAFRPKRKIRPEAGEIVLFPSYLVHWVYPNETGGERVTIAFNAMLKRAQGSETEATEDDD
ncbi:MAG TPA: TIGR02466 family protein [Tabrizicola sp.]|nr:TIGR02466 family protein [Tabrizicola sp.]